MRKIFFLIKNILSLGLYKAAARKILSNLKKEDILSDDAHNFYLTESIKTEDFADSFGFEIDDSIITTEISPRIIGSESIKVKNPSGISIPRIHIYISSRAINKANKTVPKNTSLRFTSNEPRTVRSIFLFFILQTMKATTKIIEMIDVRLSAIGCILICPR